MPHGTDLSPYGTDLESGQLAEGSGQSDKVVGVVTPHAVLADVQVREVDETADVRRHYADVVARQVECADGAPWRGRREPLTGAGITGGFLFW